MQSHQKRDTSLIIMRVPFFLTKFVKLTFVITLSILDILSIPLEDMFLSLNKAFLLKE